MSHILSGLILLSTLMISGLAFYSGQIREQDSKCFDKSTYLLRPGESLEIAVPAGQEHIRLTTMLALNEKSKQMLAVPYFEYSFKITWKNPKGIQLSENTYFERSPERPFGTRQILSTSPRNTRLSDIPIAKTGGYLQINLSGLPGGAKYLLVQGFQKKLRSEFDAQRLSLAPSEYLRQKLLSRTGISQWSELSVAERQNLVRYEWTALLSKSKNATRKRLTFCSSPLNESERKTASQALAPGRKIAFNFNGPVQLSLEVENPGNGFSEYLVTSRGIRQLIPEPEQLKNKRLYQISEKGPYSVIFHNESDFKKNFLVSIPGHQFSSGFGKTLMIPTSLLKPEQKNPGQELLLGPEQKTLYLPLAGGPQKSRVRFDIRGQSPSDILRLTLRSRLDHPADRRSREASVLAYDLQNKLIWSFSTSFTSPPSSFEILATPEKNWVSETIYRYISGLSNIYRLDVISEDEIFPGLSVAGAVKGDYSHYQVPDFLLQGLSGPVYLRYADHTPGRWHPIKASVSENPEESPPVFGMTAVTRFEPNNEEPEGNIPTHFPEKNRIYQTLTPQKPPAKVYFLEPAPPSFQGLVHCPFLPSNKSQIFILSQESLRKTGQSLSAQLWAPPEATGQRFSVSTDQKLWKEGALRQNVLKLQSLRYQPVTSVLYQGPESTRLWVQTYQSTGVCNNPHRSVTGFYLPPGARIHYKIKKTWHQQFLSFGGFSAKSSRILVRVDRGKPWLANGVFKYELKPVQTLTLIPQNQFGWNSTSGAEKVPRLSNKAMFLSDALTKGTHMVSVKNLSSHELFLRVALESLDTGGIPDTPEIKWRKK